MIQDTVEKNDIVLVGDRHDETLIDIVEQGISCLIVTGNGRVSADVIEAAEAKHLSLIHI